MRRSYTSAIIFAALMMPALASAQDEKSTAVAGGGIMAKGWMGLVDPKEAATGMTINNAKFEMKGKDLHVVTGPATTYWNPANMASGNYTVSATFNEPQFMGLNDHSHPYGIVIAGNNMGKDDQSYLYCATYGDGRFIVRGFNGMKVFNMNGRGGANEAIHKAAGKGSPVTQDVAMTVSATSVDCAVNGTVVATFPKDSLVMTGRLPKTDGMFGVRFAHNTEGTVSNLKVTKK